MLEVGKAIRMLRTAKELRLGKLAKSAEVSVAFLSLVESGARQPSLDVLRRLANALGVPPEALVLLAVSPSGSLRSTDDATRRLAESLRKMQDAENALRAKLEKEFPQGESQDSHPR